MGSDFSIEARSRLRHHGAAEPEGPLSELRHQKGSSPPPKLVLETRRFVKSQLGVSCVFTALLPNPSVKVSVPCAVLGEGLLSKQRGRNPCRTGLQCTMRGSMQDFMLVCVSIAIARKHFQQ